MIKMKGYLTKSPPKSSNDFFLVKRWKKRYFELKELNYTYILEYRKSETSKVIKGQIDLQNAQYVVQNFPFIRHRRNLFAIKVRNHDNLERIYYFNAYSIKEYDSWIQCLIKILNFNQSTMDHATAEELILAGLFNKSSVQEFYDYVDMMQHSLVLFKPKMCPEIVLESNEMSNSVVSRNKCKGFYEFRAKSTSSNNSGEVPLPVRCTSTLSSGSSSNSEDISMEAHTSTLQHQTPCAAAQTQSHSNPIKATHSHGIIINNPSYELIQTKSQEDPQEIQPIKLNYLDSNQLSFSGKQETSQSNKPYLPTSNINNSDINSASNPTNSTNYSDIDFGHTEAISKLQNRRNHINQ